MAPLKQKHIRTNHPPFMNKDIHKAIMTRTRLRNRFLKEPTPMNRLAYKKQMNYCISLMGEEKKQKTTKKPQKNKTIICFLEC